MPPLVKVFFEGKIMPDVKYDDARLLLLAIRDMQKDLLGAENGDAEGFTYQTLR